MTWTPNGLLFKYSNQIEQMNKISSSTFEIIPFILKAMFFASSRYFHDLKWLKMKNSLGSFIFFIYLHVNHKNVKKESNLFSFLEKSCVFSNIEKKTYIACPFFFPTFTVFSFNRHNGLILC